jgi:hypothetical protein
MKIAVVGLGSVGIPAAAPLAGAGHDVVGIDIDHRKVEDINAEKNLIATRGEDLDELVGGVVVEGRLRASPDFEGCGQAEAVFICVDMPIDPHSKEPDYAGLNVPLPTPRTHPYGGRASSSNKPVAMHLFFVHRFSRAMVRKVVRVLGNLRSAHSTGILRNNSANHHEDSVRGGRAHASGR